MEIPKNCNECEFVKTCKDTHFGGAGCKHKEEIEKEGKK